MAWCPLRELPGRVGWSGDSILLTLLPTVPPTPNSALTTNPPRLQLLAQLHSRSASTRDSNCCTKPARKYSNSEVPQALLKAHHTPFSAAPSLLLSMAMSLLMTQCPHGCSISTWPPSLNSFKRGLYRGERSPKHHPHNEGGACEVVLSCLGLKWLFPAAEEPVTCSVPTPLHCWRLGQGGMGPHLQAAPFCGCQQVSLCVRCRRPERAVPQTVV